MEVRYPPPPTKGVSQRYLRDTPMTTRQNACDTPPFAILSRKGIALWRGVSRIGPPTYKLVGVWNDNFPESEAYFSEAEHFCGHRLKFCHKRFFCQISGSDICKLGARNNASPRPYCRQKNLHIPKHLSLLICPRSKVIFCICNFQCLEHGPRFGSRGVVISAQ